MLLIKPTLACNFSCAYCYENRLVRNKDYDLKWMLQKMEELVRSGVYKGKSAALHGGEPLLLPKEDLEAIFKKMREIGLQPSIQTNGSLIDDDIISIFKKYDVHVGVSIDGPGKLNILRAPPNVTERILHNIYALLEAGITTSVITVVHKFNAGNDKLLAELKAFVAELSEKGIAGGRLNLLGYPAPKQYFLDEKRVVEVYRDLALFMLENGYRWSPFTDLWRAITGRGGIVCVFKPCYPFNTPSALVIRGDIKEVTNCQRHLSLVRDSKSSYIREIVLYYTPQEYGGCRGCKYFPICFGGCSANGINGDWRNRDFNCVAYRAVLELYDNILKFMGIQPAYTNKDRVLQMLGIHAHSSREVCNGCSDHTDGMVHSDAYIQHVDSDLLKFVTHSDGIEHIDSGVRHLDSG